MFTNLFSVFFRMLSCRRGKVRAPIRRSGSCRAGRSRLGVEALEDRLAPAALIFGGLAFTTAGDRAVTGHQVSSTAPVLVGVAPKAGAAFVPELSLDGGVQFSTTDRTGTFTTTGSVSAVAGSQDYELLDAHLHTFSAPQLLRSTGFRLAAGDTNAAHLPVAGANLAVTNLHLTPHELDLQGALSFAKLPGLSLPVNGRYHVAVSQDGVHLSGLEDNIKGPETFTSDGVTVTLNQAHVHFDTAKQDFAISGSATLSLGGKRVNLPLGSPKNPALTIVNGDLPSTPHMAAQAQQQILLSLGDLSLTTDPTGGPGEGINSGLVTSTGPAPVSFLQLAQVMYDSGQTDVQAAQLLKNDFGQCAVAVADALAFVYGDSLAQVTLILTGLGYPADQVTAALYGAFNASASQVAVTLQGFYKETAAQAAQALSTFGYAPTDVAAALQSAYGQTAPQAAQILAGLSCKISDIATALQSVYGQTPLQIGQILTQLGYSINDVATALTGSCGQTPLQVAQILTSVGNSPSDVALLLQQSYGQTPSQVAQILTSIGYSATSVTAVLQFVCGQTSMQVAQILNGLGYSVDAASQALQGVFNLTWNQAGLALYLGGYTPTQVAEALLNTFGQSAASVVPFFQQLGLDNGTIVTTLVGAGYNPLDVLNALGNFWFLG